MAININEITPKQKLTIAKGLCDYQYIMNYWKTNDEDFKSVYCPFKGFNSKKAIEKLESEYKEIESVEFLL